MSGPARVQNDLKHNPLAVLWIWVCRQIKPLDISYYRLLVSADIGWNIAPKGKKLLVVKGQVSIPVSFSEEISEVYPLYR